MAVSVFTKVQKLNQELDVSLQTAKKSQLSPVRNFTADGIGSLMFKCFDNNISYLEI